jgi:DDE superfamily endonuclease
LKDGALFLKIFKTDVLPICEPYPGDRSVVCMDNAPVHLKAPLQAMCAAKGVHVLFLPMYGYLYNPIELAINVAQSKLQREYGGPEGIPQGMTIGPVLREMMFSSVTPNKACEFFEHAGIPVSVADREWANR